MKATKISFIFLLIFTAILINSCSEETKVDTNMGACEILSQNPSWKDSLKKVENKYGISSAFTMAIIYQESRFKVNAKSKYSSAFGYAQAIDKTWNVFQDAVNKKAKRNNFADSAEFIGWYMSDLSKGLKLKTSDSENLYMAYMLGRTGFKRYKAGTFKNKETIQKDKQIAKKVKAYTKLYNSQLRTCKI